MVNFKNKKFDVSFDEKNGYVTKIINRDDENQMNWVLSEYDWGKVEGFTVKEVVAGENKITVKAIGDVIDSRGLELEVERAVTEDGYSEKYTFKNVSNTDYFVTRETFGIHFSFFSLFVPDLTLEEQLHKNCLAHVWCGYNTCWFCAKRLDGGSDKLFINMTEGDVCDYSIKRDISRAKGCDFRGSILLNPTPAVIGEGETLQFKFDYSFTDEKLEDVLASQNASINAYASTYTQFLGKEINFVAEYKNGIKDAKVINNGKEVDIEIESDRIKWSDVGREFGEQEYHVYINGKHTYVRVNFIDDLDTLLEKRANFIAKNQQYNKEGSRLDGAYLIYDNKDKRQFYSDTFLDRNAARERIAMGIIVLRQLQKKKDDFLMKSIKKHLEFIEREHFDIESGTPFNHLGKDNTWNRGFNYPWFGVYFKEWYILTGDVEYLRRAALCLIGYYKVSDLKYDGQVCEPYDLIELLEKENMHEYADEIRKNLIKVADGYLNKGITSVAGECAYVQECPNNRCVYASQAYLVSGKEEYLEEARLQFNMSTAFFACQPDFHMNSIAVRYWDRYWFGKTRQYGDLYPHHWSALMGWTLAWYSRASGEDCKKTIEEILKNNLCVYRKDGSAANNYLYPYKLTMYATDENHNDEYRPTGEYYGKNYDEWSNDQDWALFFADFFINRDFKL